MSSVIFQPLLHDPLGWKASNTTYTDHYQWKKQRLTRKDKIVSPYGQKFQRQLQRQKDQPTLVQRSTPSLPVSVIQEEAIPYRIASVKKTDDERRPSGSSKSTRQASSKSMRVTQDDPSASVVEQQIRASSIQRETTNMSRASQRSANTAVATEEPVRPATRSERHSAQREETGKSIVDANNDNSRHWLTYPNPKTPQNVIDSKIRLGQLKAPAILSRAKSALYASMDDARTTPQIMERIESASLSPSPQKSKSPDQRHFLDFNLPDTPDELRAARHRIEKHRYNPSLDNYPQRPQTCPVRIPELVKPVTPTVVPQTDVETTCSTNELLSIENEENPTSDEETPTVMIQLLNTDGVPSEYVEALETANAVQEEYIKVLKQNAEKKSEQFVYRLPAMTTDTKNHLPSANRQQQRSPSRSSNQSLRQQDFGAWVRQATNQERHTAMKILHDVLSKPVNNDDDILFPPSTPSAARSRSATRRLGRVRTQPRFVPDQHEQDFVQNDIWNLTRSEGMITTHPLPGSKSSVVHI